MCLPSGAELCTVDFANVDSDIREHAIDQMHSLFAFPIAPAVARRVSSLPSSYVNSQCSSVLTDARAESAIDLFTVAQPHALACALVWAQHSGTRLLFSEGDYAWLLTLHDEVIWESSSEVYVETEAFVSTGVESTTKLSRDLVTR